MEKKSKKNIIIGISILLLVTLTLLGLTYAYYRTRINGNNAEKSISVTSKKLGVIYLDGSETFSPTENGELITPGFTYTKEFKVQNTGDEAVSYSIKFDNIVNEFTKGTGEDSIAKREAYNDWSYVLIKTDSTVPIAQGKVTTTETEQIIVESMEIAAGTESNPSIDSYTLTITYANLEDIDQSDDMGSEFSLRVNIDDPVKKEEITWENATEGTLLYALRNNQPTGTEETTPGQQPSSENEARILEVEDDYGISHVYRGNVQNNYVTYSGMCWRIVRVQGDGSIKLALADGAHPCGTANGYSTTDTNSALSAFVADAEGKARKGISYKASAAYDATDFPFSNSDIPLVLSTWAENNNLDMSQLVETEWCNDTAHTGTNYYDDDWNPVPAGSNSINPDLTEKTYGAYGRLSLIETAEPSLKCNTKGIEGSTGTESQAIGYKNVLGILSADEVAFAGSTNYVDYGTWEYYYLKTNASGNGYWTLSPSNLISGDSSNVWFVVDVGRLGAWSVDDPSGSVRPAVVLRSDVTIQEGGNGQIDTPYVIV